MSKLDELIYQAEQLAKLFEHNLGTTEQEVLGKKRKCCALCGNCPDALVEELKKAKEGL